MKDIFDIIEQRKDKHIKITGEISEYSVAYDMDVINEFVSIVLDNMDHVDSTTFHVEQLSPTNIVANHGIYASVYSSERDAEYESIMFDIDIHVDNYLWRELSDFEDFIDYYTKGSIVYTDTRESTGMTVDLQEEYLSGRIRRNAEPVSIGIDWDRIANPDISLIDILVNTASRPVINHDADGDAMYAASFTFGNSSFDSSRLD